MLEGSGFVVSGAPRRLVDRPFGRPVERDDVFVLMRAFIFWSMFCNLLGPAVGLAFGLEPLLDRAWLSLALAVDAVISKGNNS
jgi:hypothetical protein